MSIGFFKKKSDFFLFHLFFLFFVVLGHFVKCFIDLFCGFPQAAEGIIKVFVLIMELHHFIMERTFSFHRLTPSGREAPRNFLIL